ncbi:MAG: methyltransferase domain-containing protein [Phyllobacteriaceae bacterium]|nr:methyltransferase domain-containing protein [Phyllobacteriaceae bacterium]
MTADTSVAEVVQNYYGRTLEDASDLKTNACCCNEIIPERHRAILATVDDEVLDRFYGCGSPVPPDLAGLTVLDLGCGAGRDAFLLSGLVGERGKVIGVDFTKAQLDVATRHRDTHAAKLGFARSNVDFRCGAIEDLAALGIADASVDLVVSNCVINLSDDKERVFSEIRRVLKPGGELFFSDVFVDRRLPAALARDPVLLGECMGGALYVEDFRRLMQRVGFVDHRVMSRSAITIDDPAIEDLVGNAVFQSMKIRAFKLADLEDICEDYGQVATYLGTIPDHRHRFELDDHHTFFTGKPMLVCGNTAAMVQNTRYGRHFRVTGDRSVHFGAFDCSGGAPADAATGACCC